MVKAKLRGNPSLESIPQRLILITSKSKDILKNMLNKFSHSYMNEELSFSEAFTLKVLVNFQEFFLS